MAAPVKFQGTLNQNAVLTGLYNMIISQEVFSDNIRLQGTLVEKFRVDGTLYGDTKLFMSTDVGLIRNFPDTSGTLLTKRNPENPEVQSVTVDTFKQTAITVDGVKLKQAFMSSDIYGGFVSVILQWLRDAYKVLNITLINTYIGTVETEALKAVVEIDYPTMPTGENTTYGDLRAWNGYLAEIIGKTIADISVDLTDAMRLYNDYEFLRAYDLSNFMIVWNKEWSNIIRHISLPMIFHKDDVIGKEMESLVINDRYFGNILETGGTVAPSNETIRTLYDVIIKVGGEDKQFFPGDLLPEGYEYGANEAYQNVTIEEDDESIICKIVHKRAVPFMSALLIQTEFYNPKDLDRNHYLTWGYSQPTYLMEFPIITLKMTKDSNGGE